MVVSCSDIPLERLDFQSKPVKCLAWTAESTQHAEEKLH